MESWMRVIFKMFNWFRSGEIDDAGYAIRNPKGWTAYKLELGVRAPAKLPENGIESNWAKFPQPTYMQSKEQLKTFPFYGGISTILAFRI